MIGRRKTEQHNALWVTSGISLCKRNGECKRVIDQRPQDIIGLDVLCSGGWHSSEPPEETETMEEIKSNKRNTHND